MGMFSRVLALAAYKRSLPLLVQKKTYAAKHARCDAHMNELPVPCIPWDVYYKDRQSFYNKWLLAGAAWWLMSCWLMIYTDSIYFNWAPPAQPGPPSDYVEECTDASSCD